MISILVGIVGYLMADGNTLGAGLVNAFEWLAVLYWIFLAIVVVLAAFIVLVLFGVAGTHLTSRFNGFSFLGATAGGALGLFIAAILVASSAALVFLAEYLAANIDPSITTFDQIGTNQWLAFGALVVVMLVSKVSSYNSSSKD